jgi:hypothetical protein
LIGSVYYQIDPFIYQPAGGTAERRREMVVSWILRGVAVGLVLSMIVGFFWGMAGLGPGIGYLIIMHIVTYLPAGWIASVKGDHPWMAAGVTGGLLYLFNFLVFLLYMGLPDPRSLFLGILFAELGALAGAGLNKGVFHKWKHGETQFPS